jgi:aminomethyltransferase
MDTRTPPLRARHAAADAEFTDFGGWDMPVVFSSISQEHAAVRDSVGLFDVSHMSQVAVDGPDAVAVTQRLVTNDVGELDPGEAIYAAVTDEDGIMLDDVVVYRLPADRKAEILLVANAGHDAEMTERWRSHAESWGLDAAVANRTDDYAMVAVQGPDSPELLAAETDVALGDLARFEVASGTVAGVDALVARTGYTGEAGFEVLCASEDAGAVWDALEARPCGLGARDTLRLEMGFLLSGEEFDPEAEPRTPYAADIGFAVALDTAFVGRDALEAVYEDGPEERLRGLTMIDRGIPRKGYEVTSPDGAPLGHVTSGTMSPTLGEGIGLAYVDTDRAGPGDVLRVVVRGEPKKARITTTPFLQG